ARSRGLPLGSVARHAAGHAVARPTGLIPLLLVAGLLLLRAERVGSRLAGECGSRTLWVGVLVVALSIAFEARLWTLDPRVNRLLQDADSDRLSPLGPRCCAPRGLPPPYDGGGRLFGALCGFLLIPWCCVCTT